ncbi:MAG TPA: protein phosphatase CheZ [Parasulfuritortus sp.]
MPEIGIRRSDLIDMVNELRNALRDIGQEPLPQAQLMTNTRDRLRYIARLTEQAASQTLNVAESLGDRLHAQRAEAETLATLTRSPRVRDFLARVQTEHAEANAQLLEVIQAQSFQDLVGQVVNRLLDTVQHMEDNLAHLLLEDERDAGLLAGPQINAAEKISQDDIDDLFG